MPPKTAFKLVNPFTWWRWPGAIWGVKSHRLLYSEASGKEFKDLRIRTEIQNLFKELLAFKTKEKEEKNYSL